MRMTFQKFAPPAPDPIEDVAEDDDVGHVRVALARAERRQLEKHYAQLQKKVFRQLERGYLLDELELMHVDHPTQHLAGIVAQPRTDRPFTTNN